MQINAAIMPAAKLANEMAWLREGSNTPVLDLVPTAPDTLEVVVHNGWFEGEKTGEWAELYKEEAKSAADHAAKWLKPVIDGVKIITRTADGYIGEAPAYPGWDEEMFLNGGIPGYDSQYASYEKDINGNGTIEPNEYPFELYVDSEADKARWQHILVDTYGSPDEFGPVEYQVM